MKYFRAFCGPKWKLKVLQICDSVVTTKFATLVLLRGSWTDEWAHDD